MDLRLSITMVVFALIHDQLCILLESDEQGDESFFISEEIVDLERDTNLESTVRRVFMNKLHADTPYLEQVQSIGNNERMPKSWSVTVNYYCLIDAKALNKNVLNSKKWFPYLKINDISIDFDHRIIIDSCYQRFQNKSLYTSLPIFLLSQEFTLTELQKAYETVLGFKMEKKSFRRRLLDAGFLEETGNIRRASHRPAQLYRLAHPQPYFFPRIIEGVRENKHI